MRGDSPDRHLQEALCSHSLEWHCWHHWKLVPATANRAGAVYATTRERPRQRFSAHAIDSVTSVAISVVTHAWADAVMAWRDVRAGVLSLAKFSNLPFNFQPLGLHFPKERRVFTSRAVHGAMHSCGAMAAAMPAAMHRCMTCAWPAPMPHRPSQLNARMCSRTWRRTLASPSSSKLQKKKHRQE